MPSSRFELRCTEDRSKLAGPTLTTSSSRSNNSQFPILKKFDVVDDVVIIE